MRYLDFEVSKPSELLFFNRCVKLASFFGVDVKYTPNLGSNKLLCAQRPGAHEVGGGEANAKE